MGKLRESKWAYMILALLVAAILWFYVGQEADPVNVQTFSNIPVTFSGVDQLESQGLTIFEGMDQRVSVRIQARTSVLRELAQEGNIVVTASVSAISEPGDYSLEYTISPRLSTIGGVLNSVEIISRTPQTIDITVSRQTDRSVEVRGVFAGSVAEGFQIGQFSFAPSTIQLSGTEEEVSRVSHAQVTLREENLSETFTGEMPFVLYDYDGNPIDVAPNPGIKTDVTTVQVTLPVVKLKEVPLRLEVVPGGGATEDDARITIEPASIVVAGSQEALDAVSEIVLSQVNLSEITGSQSFTFDIPLDEALTNISGETQAQVRVSITGLETRTVETTNIQIINRPDGMSIEAVTQACQVEIRGTQEAVDAVLPSQIRVVADCSDVSGTGTQTVPAQVYVDSSQGAGVVGSGYTISISVSR